MNLGPRPAGQPWSPAEDAQLLALLDSKMDRPSIARKLKRTVSAIVKRRFILKKRRLGRARAEDEGEIGDLPMDGNIFNSQGVHVAVVLGSSIFSLRGQKLFDLKGTKIYRLSGELVGHL